MFQIIRQITEQIINSIQNTGIAVAKSVNSKIEELKGVITTHKYQVEVQNPTEKVEVKGTVVVGNQAKLEKKVDDVNKAIVTLNKLIPTLKKIEVTNQKAFPEFPKDIRVSNLHDSTRISNINMIVDSVDDVKKAISKLKMDPQIKVEAPVIPTPVVNVPKQAPPVVKVTQKEVDMSALTDILTFWQSLTESAKRSLSVRLSDGKEFYKAIDRLSESVANNVFPFVDETGYPTAAKVDKNKNLVMTTADTWGANHTEKDGTTSYFGKEDVDGRWAIIKIVELVTDNETLTYATIVNNPGIDNYSDAWDSRSTLNYNLYSEAF